MEDKTKPYIITFESIGELELGFISVAQFPKVPFEVKRVYWTFNTPPELIRGHHSHKALKQIVFAINGSIVFNLENKKPDKYRFVLDHPSKGLFIPPGYWRTIEFSKDAVLLCLASEKYDENDYIRNYNEFKGSK